MIGAHVDEDSATGGAKLELLALSGLVKVGTDSVGVCGEEEGKAAVCGVVT